MTREKIKILVLLQVLILMSMVACTKKPEQPTPKTDPKKSIEHTKTTSSLSEQTIFIGIRPYFSYSILAIAEEKGFFAKQGVLAKTIMLGEKEFWVQGNFSLIGGGDAGDAAVNAGLGNPVSIVMIYGCAPQINKIIIKNKYKDLSELRGKKLGCKKNVYTDYFFTAKALDKYGVSLDDLEIIDMEDKQSLLAFSQGKINAVMLGEPFASRAIDFGDGKVGAVREQIDQNPLGICAKNEFIKQDPDKVVRLLKAYFNALEWSKNHLNEYYEIANRKLFSNMMSYEEFVKLKQSYKFFSPKEIKEEMKAGGSFFMYCKEILNFYYDQGLISTKPSLNTFINTELYLKAIEKRS